MKNASKLAKTHPRLTLPFDENTSVADIISKCPQTVSVFLKYQMLCVGCYVGPFHTIADASIEHDIDEQQLWRDLVMSSQT